MKLNGKFISLEILNENHREQLRHIANDDSLWTYFPYSAASIHFDEWFNRTLQKAEQKSCLPYAVLDHRIGIVGCTRIYDIAVNVKRAAIGHTFYEKSARRGYTNPEAKYLLLKYLFEKCHMERVEFRVDTRNTISIGAIKKLGAVEEGILRHHMTMESGYVRDTIMMSILKNEWPIVQKKLMRRLQKLVGTTSIPSNS